MPCATLEMTIEDSAPAITRTVLVHAEITLFELHEVICAAFGFSGVQKHRFESDHPGGRDHWTVEQEFTTALPGLLVEPLGAALYHYGDNDEWTLTIQNLGFPHDRMLVPKLVAATGPDVVEGCDGPWEMTAMRDCAVRAVAEIDLDLNVADLINAFLPGLSPELVVQRLTHADPAGLAARISYAITPQFVDGLGESGRTHGDGTPQDPLGNPEDWPGADEAAAANVPEQLPADDRHRLDPQTIAEIRDALANVSGGLDGGAGAAPDADMLDDAAAEATTESTRWLLSYAEEGLPMTQAGYLKPFVVQEIADHIEAAKYWPGRHNRESETRPVHTLRQALSHMRLLRTSKGRVLVTKLGRELREKPLELARHIADHLPLVYEVEELPAMQRELMRWHRGMTRGIMPPPASYADNLYLLKAMNVLDRDVTDFDERATPAGRAFLGVLLHNR